MPGRKKQSTNTKSAAKPITPPRTDITDLLRLTVAQARQAMTDHDFAVSKLTDAHSAIGRVADMAKQAGPIGKDLNAAVNYHLEQMVIAFQSHDAFDQRLSHVCNAIDEIIEQLANTSGDTASWDQLLEKLKASFSTEQERHVFQRFYDNPKGNDDTECGPTGSVELF